MVTTARLGTHDAMSWDHPLLAAVLQHVAVAIAALDAEGTIVRGNTALELLVGRPVAGERLDDLLEDDLRRGAHASDAVLRCDGGRMVLVHLTRAALPVEAAPATTLVHLTDVTAQRDAEVRLYERASTDHLTGLPNRASFTDRLGDAVGADAAAPGGCAVMFLDVDNFKVVNDSMGHPAGDGLLVEVARRLRAALRPGDVVSRFGGDEFTVLCHGVRLPGVAAALAERLRRALLEPVELGGERVHVRASIGVALGVSGDDPSELLSRADAALNQAKSLGRDRAVVATTDTPTSARLRLTHDTLLRAALVEGLIEAHLQPVVRLRDGVPTGVEALARWTLEDGTRVPPDTFVPLAEDLGLGMELDLLVAGKAARALSWLRTEGVVLPGFRLGCNVDPDAVVAPGFVERFLAVVRDSGYPVQDVVVELTERRLPSDLAALARALGRLRDQGVGVALDDFGVGQSSLARMIDLPVDAIKLDRTFLHHLHSNPRGGTLVAAILDMAERMELEVVAEGIETEEDRSVLAGLGCTIGQGWLFAAGVTPEMLPLALATCPEAVVRA